MYALENMRKLALSIFSAFSYLFTPALAYAQTTVNPCTDSGANPISKALCTLGGPSGENIAPTIRNIVVFFVVLAVIIALLYLVYGGIKWITSRGEKTEVEAARNHIIAAVVGLIVVFLAIFIISIVLSAFGLNFGNLLIPKITPN